MRAYGFKRELSGIQYPDCLDVSTYAMQSQHGRCRNKRPTRRYFKRRARADAKREIYQAIEGAP